MINLIVRDLYAIFSMVLFFRTRDWKSSHFTIKAGFYPLDNEGQNGNKDDYINTNFNIVFNNGLIAQKKP